MAEALPGGYRVGDIVRYTGANVTLPNGDKLGGVLMYGEVTGPVASGDRDKRVKVYLAGTDSDDDRDEHGLPLTGRMKVFFPGNKENISCLLSEVRLWRAATGPSGERLPPPPAPRWTDPRDEVSYEVGEKVIYTGASQNLPSGNKLVHGQQGEVTGPATAQMATGKGVSVLFPGNKGSINCRLTTVSRDALPLPGGYEVGETVFYVCTAENFIRSTGELFGPALASRLHELARNGQQGEVVGPATAEHTEGKGVAVRFPGNTDHVDCLLTMVSRLPTTHDERVFQAKMVTEKAAMEARHSSAELMALTSEDHAVVKFGKSAFRKTEFALLVFGESLANAPGGACARKFRKGANKYVFSNLNQNDLSSTGRGSW